MDSSSISLDSMYTYLTHDVSSTDSTIVISNPPAAALATYSKKISQRLNVSVPPTTASNTNQPNGAAPTVPPTTVESTTRTPTQPTALPTPSDSKNTDTSANLPVSQLPPRLPFRVHKNRSAPRVPISTAWKPMLSQDHRDFGWKLTRVWWHREVFNETAEQMERTIQCNNPYHLHPGDSRYLPSLPVDSRRYTVSQNPPLPT